VACQGLLQLPSGRAMTKRRQAAALQSAKLLLRFKQTSDTPAKLSFEKP
jgi:hypothetical protein